MAAACPCWESLSPIVLLLSCFLATSGGLTARLPRGYWQCLLIWLVLTVGVLIGYGEALIDMRPRRAWELFILFLSAVSPQILLAEWCRKPE